MDVSQYLDIFLDESREHLQNLNNNVLALEQDSENMDTINEIFRAAHTLKGMAGTMGYKRMQTLTHDMENVFSEVRDGNLKVNPEMIDTLFQCLDALEEYVTTIQETSDEGDNDNQPIIKALNDCLNGKGGADEAAKEKRAKSLRRRQRQSKAEGRARGEEGRKGCSFQMKLQKRSRRALKMPCWRTESFTLSP